MLSLQAVMRVDRAAGGEPFRTGEVKGRTLLLHACCGPDATTVLEWWLPLAAQLQVYFGNPNIQPAEEYRRRLEAMRVVCAHWKVPLLEGDYTAAEAGFAEALRPFAGEPEGGRRCAVCFELRLAATAQMAAQLGCEAFATTLTISPHKNHRLINALGARAAAAWGVNYIPTNLKKRGGFARSLEHSRSLELYRQRYCGCGHSFRGEAAHR